MLDIDIMKLTVLERIAKYTESDGRCNLWTGARTSWGYGHLKVDGRMRDAHRMLWEQHYGAIPEGKMVLHSCHRGKEGCVTLEHLYLGTHQDNMKDMVGSGQQCKGENSPHAKLNEDDVREIRKLYGVGWTYPELSERFGVHRANIRRICLGIRWKHVK